MLFFFVFFESVLSTQVAQCHSLCFTSRAILVCQVLTSFLGLHQQRKMGKTQQQNHSKRMQFTIAIASSTRRDDSGRAFWQIYR